MLSCFSPFHSWIKGSSPSPEEDEDRRHLTIAESGVFYLRLLKDLNEVFFINVDAVSYPDCRRARH